MSFVLNIMSFCIMKICANMLLLALLYSTIVSVYIIIYLLIVSYCMSVDVNKITQVNILVYLTKITDSDEFVLSSGRSGFYAPEKACKCLEFHSLLTTVSLGTALEPF